MPWAQEHWSKGIHRSTEAEEGQILLFRTAENVLAFHTKLMCEAYIFIRKHAVGLLWKIMDNSANFLINYVHAAYKV